MFFWCDDERKNRGVNGLLYFESSIIFYGLYYSVHPHTHYTPSMEGCNVMYYMTVNVRYNEKEMDFTKILCHKGNKRLRNQIEDVDGLWIECKWNLMGYFTQFNWSR